MAGRQSTPKVLNNGTYMQTTSYDSATHLDKAHLKYQNAGHEKGTDLGIIEPFIKSGYLIKPYLYTFGKLGKNRVYVDDNKYTWEHSISEEPLYIMEDISGVDKPGIGGEKFKIKVNKRKYDNGYVIAPDQHVAHHLFITDDEIIDDGDGVILTVKLKSIDQNGKWFPKSLLTPGTKFFAITTYDTEYNKNYPSIPSMSGGMRKYFNTVGLTSAAVHYSVTRDAAFCKIAERNLVGLKQYKEMLEMYTFREGSLGYDLSMQGQAPHSLNHSYKKKYGSKSGSYMKGDIVKKTWVPLVEALGIQWLETMIEVEALFGSGGRVSKDGRTTVQTSLGLFHQLNMGNTHVYDLYNMTLEQFEFIIASRIQDRVEPHSGNVIEIKTGRGGLAVINNLLRRVPGLAGMQTNSKDYINNIGKNKNQELEWSNPNFTSWVMGNGLGTIKFVLAPGLDPMDANEQVNPIVPNIKGIGGNRLSSYMYIIDDITNYDSGNVVELITSQDWDLRHSYLQGKMAYLDNESKPWQRSSNHPGFEVFLEKRHKAYFLKDPTKSLLIKPLNPFTNRPIYSSYLN